MSTIQVASKRARIPFKLPPPFDTLDVWDEKFDYVMHDDHWLSSRWSADCEKCRASGRRPESPVINNNVTTNNLKSEPNSVGPSKLVNGRTEPHVVITAASNATTTATSASTNNINSTISKTRPSRPAANANTTVDVLTDAVSHINLTSSPVRDPYSTTSTTIKNDTTRHSLNMDISPTPAAPPPATIAMTPIAPPSMSARAFVTPFTSAKFGGNETFNRMTRQSARKLLNDNTNQDLMDLNETFDLYRSCLAETPQLSQQNSPADPQENNQLQQQLNHQQPQAQHQQQNHNQQQQHQQQASSRIPKIPVRLPK